MISWSTPEILRELPGILDAVRAAVPARHEQGVHVLRPDRAGRDITGQRTVHSPRNAEHAIGKAALSHVVA